MDVRSANYIHKHVLYNAHDRDFLNFFSFFNSQPNSDTVSTSSCNSRNHMNIYFSEYIHKPVLYNAHDTFLIFHLFELQQ